MFDEDPHVEVSLGGSMLRCPGSGRMSGRWTWSAGPVTASGGSLSWGLNGEGETQEWPGAGGEGSRQREWPGQRCEVGRLEWVAAAGVQSRPWEALKV